MQSERKHKYSQNTLGAAENQAGGNMICGKQQVDKSYLESLLKKFHDHFNLIFIFNLNHTAILL